MRGRAKAIWVGNKLKPWPGSAEGWAVGPALGEGVGSSRTPHSESPEMSPHLSQCVKPRVAGTCGVAAHAWEVSGVQAAAGSTSWSPGHVRGSPGTGALAGCALLLIPTKELCYLW